MGLAFLRVKGVAVWTFHAYVSFIELLPLRALLELSALLAEVFHTVVLFLLVVVGYLTISAVDPCFGAGLQVLSERRVGNLLSALAGDLAIGTRPHMLEGIVVCPDGLVPNFFGGYVRTTELLLLQLMLCKPMNREKLRRSASYWTFCIILQWLLLYPLLYALSTESGLAFLAFHRV